MPPIQKMPGLGIWQCCENTRVTQGVEYAWISLSNAAIYGNMP